MSPKMGKYTLQDDIARMAAHVALPNAHHVPTPPGAWTLIEDILLVGPVASVSFVGIAVGYAILWLFWHDVYGDNAANQDLRLTFNGDGGNNYDHSIQAYNSATNTVNGTAFILIGRCGDTDGNEMYSSGKLTILNRATHRKVTRGEDGIEYAAGALINDTTGRHLEGKWRNVADEISIVTITPSVGNFVAGSRFILLGMAA